MRVRLETKLDGRITDVTHKASKENAIKFRESFGNMEQDSCRKRKAEKEMIRREKNCRKTRQYRERKEIQYLCQ